MSEHKYTNSLICESSPYLLQHAHNPVRWHPWCAEALAKAEEEDKPILLSIGYSACHWCHVMERECFEDEDIAALMNEHFINIKVDREERPDLDAVYMQAVQLMTGRGGWPMTVFLTPGQTPFYAGTYFPPEDRQGMPGFPRVLRGVAAAYRERKPEILKDAGIIAGELREHLRFRDTPSELNRNMLEKASQSIMASHDWQYGGFGEAPKFPPAMQLDVLMRSHARSGDSSELQAVETTLQHMAGGGICDQLGGGFHRYSVDAYWLVPHFEKMLYDNALLSRAYLHAFQITGRREYETVVKETLDFVRREMTSPEGGFYSSQDADSEGEEGRFYTWDWNEVQSLIGSEDAGVFCRHYGITRDGNHEGRNVLHVARPAGQLALTESMPEEQLRGRLARCKSILWAAREKRKKPLTDRKILTSWNGLMLQSFAEAAQTLGNAEYARAADQCAGFLLGVMDGNGRLAHNCLDGQPGINGFLDDYACLANGLLSLFEVSFDPRWLRAAELLAGMMLAEFRDPDGAGFFLDGGREKLICRPKEFYDHATPSGNSVAVHALLRLAAFTGNKDWASPAMDVLESMAGPMSRYPAAFANLLGALDFALSGPWEIAIVGEPHEPGTALLLREVFQRYLPNRIVASGTEMALRRGLARIQGRPTAYVCRDNACSAPATDAAALSALLTTRLPG